MIRTNKTKLTSLLLVLITLLSALFIPVGAVNISETDTNFGSEEIMPMASNNCPVYVPGIGWTGSPAWYAAIARVQASGDITGWGANNNIYLSEDHAKMLIEAAGLKVYGEVEESEPGRPHDYRHIHYEINGSRHNTIRVL